MKKRKSSGPSVRKELVRDELIDKAAELFSTRGYSRVTILDIARELHLSRSSLYHYFRNKDQILEALIQDQTISASEQLEKLLKDKSIKPTEKLRQALAGGIERKLTGSARFRVLDQIEFEMPEKLASLHSRSKRQVLDLLTRIIGEGIEAGEFRKVDVRMAAFAVLGMVNWTAWWYSPAGKMAPQDIAQTLVDIGLRGLLQPGEAASAHIDEAIRGLKENLKTLEKLAR